ncbi:MAG TPA: major capsid protein [Zeimonas sp.]|nr:major capsid protein [Zeimonas sp.]
MTRPTARQGNFDPLLTNLVVAYMQNETRFVADKVFPVVPVQFADGQYVVYPRGYFWRDQVGPRPYGGQPRVADFQLSRDTYHCEEHALRTMLDERDRANAMPPYDPEAAKVRFLMQQHLIHRDRDWVARYFQPSVWGTDLTGVDDSPDANAGTFLAFDQDDSDPIATVDYWKDAMAEATGYEPNVMVLGRTAFRVLKNHPAVIARIQYTQRGVVTAELLAELFGVSRVLAPGGVVNTAEENVNDPEGGLDLQFIVPKTDMLLCYATSSPSMDEPSAGYIFSWRGLLGAEGFAAATFRGYDDKAYSDWFDVRMAYDMKIVAPDLGIYFRYAVEPPSD